VRLVARFLATPSLIRKRKKKMVISLRSSLEMVPRIKFLVKIEGENQFQSRKAGAGDSCIYASFRLRILSLDEFSDKVIMGYCRGKKTRNSGEE